MPTELQELKEREPEFQHAENFVLKMLAQHEQEIQKLRRELTELKRRFNEGY